MQPAVPTGTLSAHATTAQPAASNVTATLFAPAQASSNRPTPDTIKEARRAGYTMKTRGDNYYFCKVDAELGTRLQTERCLTADALTLTLKRQELDREAMGHMSQASGGH